MQITVSLKLLPTKIQADYLKSITYEYIATINSIFSRMILAKKPLKLSSKDVDASLPSAVKNQAIRDSKTLFSKYKKTKKQSIAKRPVCIWNNQNYKIKTHMLGRKAWLSFPVYVDRKTIRIEMRALLSDYQLERLRGKLGTLRILKKGNKWMAQISVDIQERNSCGEKIMGIDLGIKVPAVACIEGGKTRFFGNGRQNKQVRRRYKAKRRALGKSKKLNAIRKNRNKEHRWMKDVDHKIARQIINFALENKVSVIRQENLRGIRNTARTSRKNGKNLHQWSFYRTSQFIEQKARLEGIRVEYVDPKYTSYNTSSPKGSSGSPPLHFKFLFKPIPVDPSVGSGLYGS